MTLFDDHLISKMFSKGESEANLRKYLHEFLISVDLDKPFEIDRAECKRRKQQNSEAAEVYKFDSLLISGNLFKKSSNVYR